MFGNPNCANKVLKHCMVAFDVDADIGKASIHLDPASMTIKNM